MEYISPEGLRLDGHRPMEMRQLRAHIGTVSKADGSAVFEMGNTKVLAAVYGPREVQNRSQQMNDQVLMDAKLPIDIFENVMQLAVEDCKAVANYIREILQENTKQLEYRRGQ